MLDVSGRKKLNGRQDRPVDDWVQELSLLDERGDSDQLVLSTLGRVGSLPLEFQLLVVFHAWKCGKLDLLRLTLQNSPAGIHADVDLFLTCHDLRASGQKVESLKILRELAGRCKAEIVQYRYVADYLEFGALDQAFRLMDELLPRLTQWRAATIQFNYGIAALNQSLHSVVERVLRDLSGREEPPHRFFHAWLEGQYFFEKGEVTKALAPLREALELSDRVPSRSTDSAIVAANVLACAFWAGDAALARQMLNFIQQASPRKKNMLGYNRHVVLKAMVDSMSGKFAQALSALDGLFEDTNELTRDHLNAAYLYLWLLFLTRPQAANHEVIARLERLRDQLGQSRDYFDFTLFKLASGTARENFVPELTRFIIKKAHSVHAFHSQWAQAVLAYSLGPTFENVHAVLSHLGEFPVLQRFMIHLMSQKSSQQATFWRLCREQTTDQTAAALAAFQLGRLSADPARVAQAFCELKKQGAASWLSLFPENHKIAGQLAASKAVAHLSTQRVASLETSETLDGQPQLSQLLTILLEQKQSLDKEALALGLGWNNYDPLQHDPVIHNLVARLRAWLARNIGGLEIIRNAKGWCLNSPETICVLDFQEAPSKNEMPLTFDARAALPVADYSNLHPRLEWILEHLKMNKSITRAEVLARFPVRKSTVVTDFNSLLELGLIRRAGSGRGVYYRLQGDPA